MNIGDEYGGGIVFYVDETGENGLIAQEFDGEVTYWGNDNIVTGATDVRIGAGRANTDAIILAFGDGDYAAKNATLLTVGGFTDWYLPSKQELELMLFYNELINGGSYMRRWSSTEVNAADAWIVNFAQYMEPQTTALGKYNYSNGRAYFKAIRTFGSFEPFDISTLNLTTKATISVSVTDVAESTAIAGVTIDADGGSAIQEKGVKLSATNPLPYFEVSHTIATDNVSLTQLSAGTKYYLVGYAINDAGTKYSEVIEFTTAGVPDTGGSGPVVLSLISTVAEVQSHVAVNATSNLSALQPYFRLSQRNYLLPVLGLSFFESLVTIYNTANNVVADIANAKQRNVVELAQEAIANLGVMHALPILSVQVGANGIQVIKNAEVAPASQWRTEQVFDSLAEVGHQAIDTLLAYLELEKSAFADWASGAAYLAYQKYFIRTAVEFSSYHNIKDSRYLFHVIQYCMNRVEEFEIKKAVGVTLFDYLKAQDQAGSINGKFKILLNTYLKPAIALFTIAKALQERLIVIKAGSISINFTGTNTENMYESRAPQQQELDGTINSLKEDARRWITEAQEYIKANDGDFLTYATVSASRKRMDAKNDSPGLTIF